MPLNQNLTMKSDNSFRFTVASLSAESSKDTRDLLVSYRNEVLSKRGGYQLFGDIGDIDVLISSITASNQYSYSVGAFSGENLVGVAWARVDKNGYYELCCEIGVLIVLEPYRSRGIGDSLFTSVKVWAKEMGAVSLDMTVLPGDRHTKNFCERHGLVARSLEMHQAL